MPDTGSRGTLVPVGSSLTDEVYGPDADHAKDATQGRDGIPSAQSIVSCIARFQGLESQKPYIKSSRSRAKLSSGKSLNHKQMKKAYQLLYQVNAPSQAIAFVNLSCQCTRSDATAGNEAENRWTNGGRQVRSQDWRVSLYMFPS